MPPLPVVRLDPLSDSHAGCPLPVLDSLNFLRLVVDIRLELVGQKYPGIFPDSSHPAVERCNPPVLSKSLALPQDSPMGLIASDVDISRVRLGIFKVDRDCLTLVLDRIKIAHLA